MSSPRRRLLIGLAGLASGVSARPADEPGTLRLGHHVETQDPQADYIRRLIELALQRADSRLRIERVQHDMPQGRSLVELAAGKGPVDLNWAMTDREREASGLIPVRIPLDRGLLGWRVPVVRRADLPRWAEVNTKADLRRYTAGQAHDWPDTAILRANELPVVTANNYLALFRMLAARRFDYFPRSILEVDAELADPARAGLAQVPGLLLHYPAAAYLFVSPRRPALARELTRGLEAVVADGSLQQLHREAYGQLLRAHPVHPDRVITLKNPLLPPLTPLNRPELWLQPGQV